MTAAIKMVNTTDCLDLFFPFSLYIFFAIYHFSRIHGLCLIQNLSSQSPNSKEAAKDFTSNYFQEKKNQNNSVG